MPVADGSAGASGILAKLAIERAALAQLDEMDDGFEVEVDVAGFLKPEYGNAGVEVEVHAAGDNACPEEDGKAGVEVHAGPPEVHAGPAEVHAGPNDAGHEDGNAGAEVHYEPTSPEDPEDLAHECESTIPAIPAEGDMSDIEFDTESRWSQWGKRSWGSGTPHSPHASPG